MPYLEKLLRVQLQAPLERGKLTIVEVRHEDGCPAIGNGGDDICTCEDPEIVFRPYEPPTDA